MRAVRLQSVLMGCTALLLGMTRLSLDGMKPRFHPVYAVLLILFGATVGFFFAGFFRQSVRRGAAFASPSKLRAARRKLDFAK